MDGSGKKTMEEKRRCERAGISARRLREAVDGYFRSISRVERDGDFLNANGEEAERVVYAEPPTLAALCLRLGIDPVTWQSYEDEEKNPALAPVCRYARLRILAYLNRELLTREKSVQGIVFNLQNNSGDFGAWSTKNEQTVEVGDETRQTLLSGMTLDEKFTAILEAAADIRQGFGAAGDTAHDGT